MLLPLLLAATVAASPCPHPKPAVHHRPAVRETIRVVQAVPAPAPAPCRIERHGSALPWLAIGAVALGAIVAVSTDHHDGVRVSVGGSSSSSSSSATTHDHRHWHGWKP